MSITTESAQAPRPEAPRPSVPTTPPVPATPPVPTMELAPSSDVPTDRIRIIAAPGAALPEVPHWSQRAVRSPNPTAAPARTARHSTVARPNPTLAVDLAALAFAPPALLLRAIPAPRTPSAAESAA